MSAYICINGCKKCVVNTCNAFNFVDVRLPHLVVQVRIFSEGESICFCSACDTCCSVKI